MKSAKEMKSTITIEGQFAVNAKDHTKREEMKVFKEKTGIEKEWTLDEIEFGFVKFNNNKAELCERTSTDDN